MKALEGKYRNQPVVVIGVHSAKFHREGETEAVRDAVRRMEIRHPVIVDQKMKIWQSWGVRAWPTIVVIDPEGYAVGGVSGEGNAQRLDQLIAGLLQEFGSAGKLDRSPLPIEFSGPPQRSLMYPHKTAVHPLTKQIAIADTGHIYCRRPSV